MDTFGVMAFVKDFDKRHGNDAVQLNHSWLLFSDGAKREIHPMGVSEEPSADPAERAKWVVKYHEIKLAHALKKFDEQKDYILAGAKVPGSVFNEEECVRELKTLQDVVLERKAKHEEAVKALNIAKGDTPEVIKQREQSEAADALRRNDFVTAIKKITV